jgi:hypothetical protein
VSQEQLDRALRVFQGLLTAFEARGWPVELVGRGFWDERAREYIKPDGKPGASRVRVDGEWINLRLSEKSCIEKTPQTPPRGLRGSMLARWHELHRPNRTQHPSGVLWLVLEAECGRRALKDGGRKTLEEKLAEPPREGQRRACVLPRSSVAREVTAPPTRVAHQSRRRLCAPSSVPPLA